MASTTRSLCALCLVSLGAALGLGASCQTRTPTPPHPTTVTPEPAAHAVADPSPTARIYYLVDLDGYLEPCGCQQRPLGGIDRLARIMEREHAAHPDALFVATGNLFYNDPHLDPRMVYQERAKADAMTRILDGLQLAAFAPGPADFALGAPEWQRLTGALRATPLAANAGMAHVVVREVNHLKVGVVGVSDFHLDETTNVPGAPDASDPVASARASVAEARAQGAQVVVVLASVPRRVARAIASSVPGVDFVIAAREESTVSPPPERVGGAFVLTATNQGKGLGVIDLYVRGDGAFVDASESSATADRARLDGRIRDLRARIAQWSADPSADRAAVDAQRQRLAALEREREGLGARAIPAQGRAFRATALEVSPDVPKLPSIEQQIATYFREVNEHNRVEYASLRAPPAPRGTARYLGGESCRECHEEAYTVWQGTPHSHAYRTLVDVSKNFNLSCVGCHVTGYRQPGGAEVVQNDGLRDVQCETCHGPGSLHAAARGAVARRATIRRTVDGQFCATQCHTMEHSDHFNFEQYLPRILGPGHGHPVDWDAGPTDAGAVDAARP